MIEVGLTSIADHPELSAAGKKQSTLADYAGHFPIVEIDTTFYGLKSAATVAEWQQQVPARFRFIVKVPSVLTRHHQAAGSEPVDIRATFATFAESLAPIIATKQLAAVFFQFPPYFGVDGKNVQYLTAIRQFYPDLPVAIEFRHSSWYASQYRKSTLDLMKRLNFIHVVVDEPQTAAASVPMVPVATNADLTIMRLHGRNTLGWTNQERKERTNYTYSQDELVELATVAQSLTSKNVVVIFNNNGGGAAATNAQAFIDLLGLNFEGLAPTQLDLF